MLLTIQNCEARPDLGLAMHGQKGLDILCVPNRQIIKVGLFSKKRNIQISRRISSYCKCDANYAPQPSMTPCSTCLDFPR